MTTDVDMGDVRRATRIGASLRQQTILLGASGRWAYLILGLLALLLLLGMTDIPREAPCLLILAQFALLAGVTWAVMVWFGEGPDRRSYQWSFPVSRPAHDLARVAVGAAYLLGICAALAGAGAVSSALNGTFDRFGSVGAASWVNYFLTPLIVYLLVMPVVLWSDYAITRWVFAIVLGMGLLAAFLGWQGVSLPGDVMRVAFEAEHWGLGPALFDWSLAMAGPEPAGAVWTAEALWFAVGMGLTVFTAVFRPDDLRRLVRTG